MIIMSLNGNDTAMENGMDVDGNNEQKYYIGEEERVNLAYHNLSCRFREQDPDFNNQYCKIYLARLEQMREILLSRIQRKWGDTYPVCKLYKLQEEDQRKCIVTGTIFKDQKLKPSILKQISEANSLIPQPVYAHFTDESDVLYLEDEVQRYQLVGALDIHQLVTGVSCALLGTDMGKGKFAVDDYCFATCESPIERPIFNDDYYVAFISGLDIANLKSSNSLRILIQWLSGMLDSEHQEKLPKSKIPRLIIAGNSIRNKREVKPKRSIVNRNVESNETLKAVECLDFVLSEFSYFMNVDIMPGEFDPSNHVLPQQPLHRCIFPQASKNKTLHRVSNPYDCNFGGVRILGTAGQPVTDITRFSELEDPIEALERCLKWGHLAPTAPDTLGCFPYYKSDPFIIKESPHVLFAGNQPQFQSRLFKDENGQEVRLLCIPQFAKTGAVVLLNLRTLEPQEVRLQIPDSFLFGD